MRKQRSFSTTVAGILSVSLLAGISVIGQSAKAQNTSSPQTLPRYGEYYLPDTPANRELYQAILQGNLKRVQAALDAGASPDACRGEDTGKTPDYPILFYAGFKFPEQLPTYLPIFRLLTQRVSNVNIEYAPQHKTLLMAAVDMGDLEIVKSLIERGAKINTQNAIQAFFGHSPMGGDSVLIQAIPRLGLRGPDPDPITAYLLEKGADVNQANIGGLTPLIVAAQFNKPNVVRLLLQKGADPNIRDSMECTALAWAVKRGYDNIVSLLSPVTTLNLWEAAQQGKAVRVQELLDGGADPNGFYVVTYHNKITGEVTTGSHKDTPLMMAAKSDDVATVQALLDAGADAKTTYGANALCIAANYGSNTVIPLLLKAGADINAPLIDNEDVKSKARRPLRTSLIAAVEAARADTVSLLLASGVDLTAYNQGDNALELILKQAGNPPHSPNDLPGYRILSHAAALSAQSEIMKLLITAGTNPDRIGAVAIAADNDQPGLIQYLLAKGASPNAHYNSGSDDKTALIAAIEGIGASKFIRGAMNHGSITGPKVSDVTSSEQLHGDCITILLQAKADVNDPRSDTGETPFMAAIKEGKYSIAAELLKQGAKQEAVDKKGRTALLRAAASNDLSAVKWLLEKNVNVNRRDNNGFTALMLAIDSGENAWWEQDKRLFGESDRARPNPDGHPAMVALLLAHGADKSVVASDGKTTALSLAQANVFPQVETMLQAK